MKNIIVPKNSGWQKILKDISENMENGVIHIEQDIVNTFAKSTPNVVNLNGSVMSYMWRATKNLPVSTIQIKKEEKGLFKVVALNYNGKLKVATKSFSEKK